MNYQIELKNYLTRIYNEKIYQILIKEDIDKLKNMNLDELKSLINSQEVYLGSDFDDYIINLIPEGFNGFVLREALSKYHNLTYPLLYNVSGNEFKNHTHSKFAVKLWVDFTNETFIKDLDAMFSKKGFSHYVNENLDNIYKDIINKVEVFKNENNIVISYEKNNLVNTVKEMILNGKLDFSYALYLVDMDKLRKEMEGFVVNSSFYDEFDKLEDDLEDCLNRFFKYNEEELLNFLINKENFTLIDDQLVKKI